MKTKIILILIAVAIVGFTGWKLVTNKKTLDRNAELSLVVNTVVPVTVEKPQYTSIDRRFSVNGQIVSGNEVSVLSKTTAAVLKKYRKAGDAVGKGTVIAQLENGVLSENLRLAETDLAKAQKDVERYRKLSEAGAVTAMELENAQAVLRGVESRIAELKDQLANTTVVSPVAGIIDRDYFEEGTLLAAGSPVVDIVNGKSLKMKINVTEKELMKLKKGDKTVITTDLYPGKTYAGTTEVIAPKGNDMYNYSVELKLADNDDLKPGMYATASFDMNENSGKVIAVNRKAIVGGMKAPHVFVVRDNKAHKMPVQLGQVNHELAEIRQGVTADDVVIVSGQASLRDGMEISVIK